MKPAPPLGKYVVAGPAWHLLSKGVEFVHCTNRHRGRAGRHTQGDKTMLPGAARRETGPDLPTMTREAVRAAEGVLQDATRAVRARVAKDSQALDRLLDREQRATHAPAWLATY